MKFKLSFLIAFQAILFVFFLLVTTWFNRFSADDYLFIGELTNHTFSEIYQKLYLTWNGRWAYNFTILFFLEYHQTPSFLLLFNVLSFAFLLGVIFLFFKQLTKKFEWNYGIKETVVYSIIFCGVFFFFTHLTGQSWLWISASLAYLWSCIFFLLGLSSLIKTQPRFWDYGIVIISGFYIGGSNEVLAIFVILLLLYAFFKSGFSWFKALALISVLGSFAANYFSPGTAFRDELTPNLPLLDLVLYVGYGTVKYLILDGYKTILPAIIFSFPFYLLGKNSSVDFGKEFQLKKELVKTLLFIGSIVVLNQLIVIYALGGLAPDRATISSSLLGSLVLVRFIFLYGIASKRSKTSFNFVLPTTVVLMVVFNAVFFVIHYNYGKSVDERLTYIEMNKHKDVIELKKLADSGYLNSAEISADSTHFLNQHLKYGLGIKGQLVLKEN